MLPLFFHTLCEQYVSSISFFFCGQVTESKGVNFNLNMHFCQFFRSSFLQKLLFICSFRVFLKEWGGTFFLSLYDHWRRSESKET